jgi:hypothetical protein
MGRSSCWPVLVVGFALFLALACGTPPSPGDAPDAGVVTGGDPASQQDLIREARPTGLKILVIGVDGATFDVIDPLLAQGKLPTLARLMERGVHGPFLATRPMLSPALWTTIATGHPRGRHGIVHFRAPESTEEHPVLVTSGHRQTLAVWNLAGFFGMRSTVIGWWVTWPAEEVEGQLVSDRFARSRWSAWTDGDKQTGLTWPTELAASLRPLMVDPASPPLEELRAILPMGPAQEKEMRDARAPIFHHGPSVLKFAWCAQRTYENIARELIPGPAQADLSLLFLVAVDPVSHTFWHYHQPEAFPELEGRRPGPGDPVVAMYEHNDAFLAEILAAVDPGTVVLLLSDHGFRATGNLPQAVPEDQFDEVLAANLHRGEVTVGNCGRHDEQGVLVAAGGPFLPGRRVAAQHLDITPTLLYLLGLPVPRDMPGRVLTEALDPDWVAAHPLRRVDTFEGVIPEAVVPSAHLPEAASEEDLERLRALGYVR